MEEWTLSGIEIPVYSGRPSIACAVVCQALACLAFLILVTIQAYGAEPRRVLLLHAFGHPYSPWSDEAGAFRAELIKRSTEQIELYEASLDTGRVRDVQAEEPFVSYIHALLSGQRPDLLVPAGAPAAFC